jgi:hypothetical protein
MSNAMVIWDHLASKLLWESSMGFLRRGVLSAVLALLAVAGVSLLSLGTAATAARGEGMHDRTVAAGRRQDPSCGRRVADRHIVQTYKMRRFKAKGYRTATLYCGKDTPPHGYGYRHLKIHIGQYFGGWENFDFSINKILLKPAAIKYQQDRGTYLHTGPIFECFPTEGFHIIWTFYVATAKRSGSIITAYGREGSRVEGDCPL